MNHTHFLLPPPPQGEASFLVLGQCEGCGWWCACHEGAHWPHCPICGSLVKPPTEPTQREAFFVQRGPEREIVERVRQELTA